MKLKLTINGSIFPDDYKLLQTTITTIASLRKTAILRFTNERLVIISTPKTFTTNNNNNTTLQADTGQLWCSIPKDVFIQYTIDSMRELDTITMECNCDTLLSAFKKYDRILSQGSSSDMLIKLQAVQDWNNNYPNNNNNNNNNGKLDTKNNKQIRQSPIHALSIKFDEFVHTRGGSAVMEDEYQMDDDNNNKNAHNHYYFMGNSKKIQHSFKIPVKLLLRSQDHKIQEPLVNHDRIVIYKLPSIGGEFGGAFHNFIKRIERYNNVTNIKLTGKKCLDDVDSHDNKSILCIGVDETNWHLEISWNGPLDTIIQDTDDLQPDVLDDSPRDMHEKRQQLQSSSLKVVSSQHSTIGSPNKRRRIGGTEIGSLISPHNDEDAYIADMYRIEDSELANYPLGKRQTQTQTETQSGNGRIRDNNLENVSELVERAEQESSSLHEVMLRSRDWKVCGKLYAAFEDVALAIAHDHSLVFHCSLDRGTSEDSNDLEQPREKGQIVYYIARSKGLSI
ncbi:Mec3p NDAI_0I01860 [Naumovozyma dairenensis CBS 421]|uniref:Uncharacterized protein n=1 Tax=Naumovozyma dairenensis (strain ATCC 10597 / BCRC 20456 / CBS 421 / NBRC 0211 / NRRL Y-12639) TaxID=1071378 RepID=G0WG44_NAUDC|nr:hypothetical protein NDAI_0I01860 [Naumovozyma dairenensis CBS 421]CCD26755.1 hypothetical protein NDAI_0I01860 [Naumovozyma dairenensis CBS 421]